MKLNFCTKESDRIEGFMNIHPYGSPDIKNSVFHINFDNLNELCDDGESEQIRVNDVLSKVKMEFHQSLINYWAKKLAFGGTISFVDYDCLVLSRAFSFKQINQHQYNEMVIQNKQAATSILYISELLQNAGLVIKQKKIDSFKFIIVAERVS